MTDRIHELEMENLRLRARLHVAENVCAMVGWTAAPPRNAGGREGALSRLWRQWSQHPGVHSDVFSYPWLHNDVLGITDEPSPAQQADALVKSHFPSANPVSSDSERVQWAYETGWADANYDMLKQDHYDEHWPIGASYQQPFMQVRDLRLDLTLPGPRKAGKRARR
jgi:hypothetical protein